MLTAKQSEHGTSRAAATIWGMVIVPLNKPRYAPMCLPEIELVRMVKGIASIAAQAVPTREVADEEHPFVVEAERRYESYAPPIRRLRQ